MLITRRILVAALSAAIASRLQALPASAAASKHLAFTTPHSNYVTITVGDGPAIPAVFDAGSIGLLVFGPVKGAVATSDAPIVRTYGGVTQYHISFATAKVSIAGLSTTTPIKIGIINEKSCVSTHPCPVLTGAALTAAAQKAGRIAIMGVEPGASYLENPLEELPAPYSDGYVISNGGITLGKSGDSGFKHISLPPFPQRPGQIHSSNYKQYNNLFTSCLTLAGTSVQNACVPTIFDSGNGTISIPKSSLATLPTSPTSCRITIGRAVDWSFSANKGSKAFPLGAMPTQAVLGLPTLLAYDIEVSFKNGTYGFKKLTHPLPPTARRSI